MLEPWLCPKHETTNVLKVSCAGGNLRLFRFHAGQGSAIPNHPQGAAREILWGGGIDDCAAPSIDRCAESHLGIAGQKVSCENRGTGPPWSAAQCRSRTEP